MWVLKLGRKPLEWTKPETKGKRPPPRYAHSMSFYEDGNFLVIHGGRNDMRNELSFALNDTYILELSKLQWCEVILYSDYDIAVYNRCGHSSIVYCNILFFNFSK